MSCLFLTPDTFTKLSAALTSDKWVIACLCAAWCDVCKQYRAGFEALAEQFPAHQFVWIDIEDQSDFIGDMDVENFPTILLQRGDVVAFYGTMMPEPRQVARLLEAQLERTDEELQRESTSTPDRSTWQKDCSLKIKLSEL